MTNYSKVIKGEIHNVLSVMRADPRYAPPSRFNLESTSSSSHPLISSLLKLNEYLTFLEINQSYNNLCPNNSTLNLDNLMNHPSSSSSSLPSLLVLDSLTYLSPFCTAVSSPDISAPVTGAALVALHKFLLYGFVDPSKVRDAKESITIIARCIRHCSFEESDHKLTSRSVSTRTSSIRDGKSMTISPSHKQHNKYRTMTSTSLQTTDEEVVLKLLSLASVTIRSPAGIALLESSDVLGIFDTCLHVATQVGEDATGLLRCAAADCLADIVIVVFGNMVVGDSSKQKHHTIASDKNITSNIQEDVDDDSMIDETCKNEGDDQDDGLCTESSKDRDNVECDKIPSLVHEHSSSSLPHEIQSTNTNNNQSSQNHTTLPNNSSLLLLQPQIISTADQLLNSSASKDESSTTPAFVTIMSRLASLVNPLTNPDYLCTKALQLINIALETASSEYLTQYPELLNVLKNTLCKHLLYLSTTSDLGILSQTLRVIFNLFNSIKHHLKVQLEVFLTSVHLRILDDNSRIAVVVPEKREIALESLLEFCNEPALMQNLYTNYDCDVKCTNLFETICRVLACTASGMKTDEIKKLHNTIDEGDRTVPSSDNFHYNNVNDMNDDSEDENIGQPMNILNKLACEGILSVIDSISRRCTLSTQPTSRNRRRFQSSASMYSNLSDSDIEGAETESVESEASFSNTNDWLDIDREHTSKMLSARKQRKYKLTVITRKFNHKPMGKEWIQASEDLGLLPKPSTPRSIAHFLFHTPKLDKTQIGVYLSKGPKEKYPFHAEVLQEFVSLFDFVGMEFSDALRKFLLRFKLPGEAQCIDRLMEAFAIRLYEQNMEHIQKTPIDQANNDCFGDVSHGTSLGNVQERVEKTNNISMTSIFKNSDSVFILSFSTIMLNTDLHNPTIHDDRRMTLEQFIRNNRGINGGEDFPAEFLTDLYNQIKMNEIQVQRDLSDVIIDENGDVQDLDDLLSHKVSNDDAPFVTLHNDSQNALVEAGLHERDMFLCIAPFVLESISRVFTRTFDDSLVLKTLNGLKQMAQISIYFGLDGYFNQILEILLDYGREYLIDNVKISTRLHSKHSDYHEKRSTDEDNSYVERTSFSASNSASPPRSLSLTFPDGININSSHIFMANDSFNTIDRKGFLSIDTALTLAKNHINVLREAWPSLIDCLFSLGDVNGLPVEMANLDDFADSNGHILPASALASRCRRDANEYFLSTFQEEVEKSNYWPFSTIFKKNDDATLRQILDSWDQQPSVEEYLGSLCNYTCINPFVNNSIISKELMSIVQRIELERAFVGKKDSTQAKLILTALLEVLNRSPTDPSDSLIHEHHAVFALELAARCLFTNRHFAVDLFPIFLSKFEPMLLNIPSDVSQIQYPYLLERVVVTILRSCIHMLDIPEVRPQLMTSLVLLTSLPDSFSIHVGNRLACGMAIIIRCSYLLIKEPHEWQIFGTLLDRSAQFPQCQHFIFHGVASCVDDGLLEKDDRLEDKREEDFDDDNKQTVSRDGAMTFVTILLKFIFGSYGRGDLSFSVPSMFCLEKVYRYLQRKSNSDETSPKVDDEELWRSVCSAYYSIALNNNMEGAMDALDKLYKHLSFTPIHAVSGQSWLCVLETLSSKLPKPSFENCRIKAFHILCKTILTTVPALLLKQNENTIDSLREIMGLTAEHAGTSLRAGRNGKVTPLFESTVEILTNTVNVMTMSPRIVHHQGDNVDLDKNEKIVAEIMSNLSEPLFLELEKGDCVDLDKNEKIVAEIMSNLSEPLFLDKDNRLNSAQSFMHQYQKI